MPHLLTPNCSYKDSIELGYRERGSCYRNLAGEDIIKVTMASVFKASETTEPRRVKRGSTASGCPLSRPRRVDVRATASASLRPGALGQKSPPPPPQILCLYSPQPHRIPSVAPLIRG